MKQCPSLQDWLDLTEARTTPERAALLQAHQESGCAACAAQLAWIGRTLAAFSQVAAPGLAETTRLALRELAAARLEARERPLWIATLLRDTRLQQAAGARGSDEGIQLRYDAGDYEIRLWAEATEVEAVEPWYLIGQVYDRAAQDFLSPEAVLMVGAQGNAQTAHTEDLEFHFGAVAAGTYRLAVRLSNTELLVPELTLEGV
jgi:hypothetical protein